MKAKKNAKSPSKIDQLIWQMRRVADVVEMQFQEVRARDLFTEPNEDGFAQCHRCHTAIAPQRVKQCHICGSTDLTD